MSCSPSPSRLVPQVLAAMLQRRRFDATLRPSPDFSGWSPDTIAAVLSSIPRLLLPSPRSIARQPPTPPRHRSLSGGPSSSSSHSPRRRRLAASLSLAFFSWSHAHSHLPHTDATVRAAAIALARARALPPLWHLLRSSASVVTTATVTAVIKVLGEENLGNHALAAFHRMRQFRCSPDAQCYNTVVGALCRAGEFKKARFLVRQMELPGARCPPDAYTYTVLISWYCRMGLQTGCLKAARRRIWEASRLFRRMVFNGLAPDVVTYNCLINGLCKTYRVERAHEVFDEMVKKGCVPNRVTYNSFVRYYSAVNEVDKAVGMTRDMVGRGHGVAASSTYTPVIHSLCESGRVQEARGFLIEMVEGGHVPREYTYKLVKDAIESAGEDALPEELCRRVDDGIRERFRQVMRVKPIMRLVTR